MRANIPRIKTYVIPLCSPVKVVIFWMEVIKMDKRRLHVILTSIVVVLLLCSAKPAYAQANTRAKDDRGEHKAQSEGKRVAQAEMKNKGGTGNIKDSPGEKGGVGQTSKTPPGWSKGLKKGWEKSTPPGWDKWSKKTRKKWKSNLAKTKKRINARAKKKGWDAKERERASVAIEFAARKGVPIYHVRIIANKCLRHGLKSEEVLGVAIALSKGVSKGINFKTLGIQVVAKLKAGYKGQRLANEIHAMIESRYKAKMKAQEEKVGKPTGREKPKSKNDKEKTPKVSEQKKERPGNEKSRKPINTDGH